MNALAGRDFISTTSFERDELETLLDRAAAIKRGDDRPDLNGRILLMLFFNPSLRTRVSFEIAMLRMGGHAVVLNAGTDTWSLEHREGVPMLGEAAEHVKDAARVLSRYGDAIAVRAFAHGNDWATERTEPLIMGAQRVLGFDVVAEGERLVIGDVIPGSPAQDAGLRVGDHVVSVDGQPIEELHGTAAWSSLIDRERLRLVLRGTEGETREIAVPVFEVIPAS